ncbi:MAG: hypothetical protein HY774_11640 [Acidobacteria bacterium]|nr:hypothetical protein [Acidobacteriota bacterium]
MKNDLNFAQNSTTLIKDQCRPVRDIARQWSVGQAMTALTLYRTLLVTPTKLTSTRSFSSFMSFMSFGFGSINPLDITKPREEISILGEI